VKPIDLRTNLSSEAQAIILRALSFERTARYQSAAEFGDSLARALLNEGETAPRHHLTTSQLDEVMTLKSGAPQSIPESTARDRRFRLGKLQLAVMFAFLVVLIAVFVVLWIMKQGGQIARKPDPVSSPTPTETTQPSTHAFVFSLRVQRVRNRMAFQAPFPSDGQDVFDSGDKFQLQVKSSNPGYVYVFNEGTPEPNTSSFTIIYPVPSTNKGSASVGGNQWARTNWNRFGGEPGTENLWLVWSAAPVPQLESGKTAAFNSGGRLTGQSLDAVKAFLTTKRQESDAKINRDKTTQQTTVRGFGDVVVRMVELQHR